MSRSNLARLAVIATLGAALRRSVFAQAQLDENNIDGWTIDGESRREIDAILSRFVTDPVSPAFMAPPVKRPVGELTTA